MSGAILQLPQYASMAWCSVKAQGQIYLYILPLLLLLLLLLLLVVVVVAAAAVAACYKMWLKKNLLFLHLGISKFQVPN
jgi:hypothetical protein